MNGNKVDQAGDGEGTDNDRESRPLKAANDLPDGWTIFVVPRKSDDSKTKHDTYWISPQNSYTFNSKRRAHRFCAFLEQARGCEALAYGLYSMAKTKRRGNAVIKVNSSANNDENQKKSYNSL